MISGIYTAIMLITFLGIVAWAWSKHNKTKFEELSHLALKDDHELSANQEDKNHE
jgi:cytochrome c oxidase cbb3-type subunit 4